MYQKSELKLPKTSVLVSKFEVEDLAVLNRYTVPNLKALCGAFESLT